MQIELPYPPSVNHYWRRVGSKTLISRNGRAFREEVCAILAAARVRPIAGRLAVDVQVYPPDRRRRDIDNVQKSLLDALAHGGAYEDDSQIDRITIERCEVLPDSGKVVVKIVPLTPR